MLIVIFRNMRVPNPKLCCQLTESRERRLYTAKGDPTIAVNKDRRHKRQIFDVSFFSKFSYNSDLKEFT